MTIAAIILLLAALAIGAHLLLQRRRRARLLAAPLSAANKAILVKRVPLYEKLPENLRPRLEGLVNRFLDEVTFYGAKGVEITDDIRVTIAAQASFLIVNKPNRWFHTLRTIHIYPAAFKSKLTEIKDHVHSERDQARTGESWAKGPVILAWDHAAFGAVAPHDGHNVVMHEFAHQLDEQTGATDGSPLLDADHSASRWARVFQDAYERLREHASFGRETVMDYYGATNPAEFFAVVTEVFFERPRALRAEEPALYAELVQYYRLDPAAWR
ncbi:zinc-dependent peptidase [Hyphococcus flavus]|uniref:Zinc-dependent peptidase n=1 Tax=Hyphococcus flavus TaxID=1866326 RepID=A0AAE9ZA61_9PROT|nr:M90 family metallopeptidase [Hyphococcus flavus]WDI30413.1 zinc-dependent peptidase [Hyphococcus flavus]